MKRSRLRRTTSKRRAEQAQYSRQIRVYKLAHPLCEACRPLGLRKAQPATDVHHKMGCEGKLLLDERYWMPVCRGCHSWIEDHGRLARELGFVLDKDYRTI